MTRLQPFFSTIELSIGYLNLAEIQKIIKEELRHKSGIYGFLCKTNNKLYIGSSKTLLSRFNNHINGYNSNILLQNAINKYNLQDFTFIIFEYCEIGELISREQFYMDELKPEYNILQVAGSLLGFIHSEETKAKISKALTGENHPMFGIIGENHPRFGIFLSADIIANMSKAQKSIDRTGQKNPRGMLGRIHTSDTLAKMSIAKGVGTIFVYDTQGSLVNTFISARKAAVFFNTNHQIIMRYVRNGGIFKEQWILSRSLISSDKKS